MARTVALSQQTLCSNRRKVFFVLNYGDVNSKICDYHHNLMCCQMREKREKESFVSQWSVATPKSDAFGRNAITSISTDLKSWAMNSCYHVCRICNSINYLSLAPNFASQKLSCKKKCTCVKSRYVVPRFCDIPDVLKNLSYQNVLTLRPFELDCGKYKRARHGYRLKTSMISVKVSPKSVLQKIEELGNPVDRRKCVAAYAYLMDSADSSYSHFVALREELLVSSSNFNCFNWSKSNGIERALWPNLYPFTDWCESSLSGQKSRLSAKVSFCHKLFSEIPDYAIHFDLLQWQYDRAIYKVVSGAINTARLSNCSPARALDSKPFSPTYWQWQHRYLLDAVDQFGLPDVFITISPFEWSFPFAKWISDIRGKTGKGPTELACFETYHISHVLEQIVRGYLCGSNSKKWRNHIFSYNRSSSQKNVKTYFYRFEFQDRGTVHMHMLVWLNNITMMQHDLIRADIPRDNPDLSYLVHKLQPSNKRSYFLSMQNEESFFEFKDGKYVHHLKHPPEEFALKLRAYIATVVPALECRMDYQTTDGLAMLLRYVTSYVTKSHDSNNLDGLYSYKLAGHQAAIRYLLRNNPAEPEMWFFMFPKKIAWTCSRTKRYVVPSRDKVAEDKLANSYWVRPKKYENMCLLQWLRVFNTNKSSPKPYESGSTLVGAKILSVFNPQYFFQYILLNLPHRNIEELSPIDSESKPEHLRWFAAALHHFPNLWNNETNLKGFLRLQGHSERYIHTIIAYVQSLHDLYYLLQIKVINCTQLQAMQPADEKLFPLDMQQLALLQHVDSCVELRCQYYNDANNSMLMSPYDSDEDTDAEMDVDAQSSCSMQSAAGSTDVKCTCVNQDLEWQRPILVTGKAGSGKTYAICHLIKEHSNNGANILLAAPTGFLASTFRSKLPDNVTCDTVHSVFHVPVSPNELPTVNWAISQYDIVVIDEISMIPETIFKHILHTLNRLLYRPILVVSGDNGQQQPFEKKGNATITVSSFLCDKQFISSTYCYHFNGQHRIGDKEYLKFLDHIRNWIPNQFLLDEIQCDRVLCHDNEVHDEKLLNALKENPETTVLTFTNVAANEINKSIVSMLFQKEEPLGYIQFDSETSAAPIFQNMRVMITQNQDKSRNVVNGQIAVIKCMQNTTIILRLLCGSLVPIYPITVSYEGMSCHTFYPIRLAYANTMCKVQGQTVKKAILWFDIDNIPPGTGYVAMSRVKSLQDVRFLKRLKPCFFTPVKQVSNVAI